MVLKSVAIISAMLLTAGVALADGLSKSGSLEGGRQIGAAGASIGAGGGMGGEINASQSGLSAGGEMGGTVGLSAAGTEFSRTRSIGGSISLPGLRRLSPRDQQQLFGELTAEQLQALRLECKNDDIAEMDRATCKRLAKF